MRFPADPRRSGVLGQILSSVVFGQLGDHLDFKLKAIEPGDAHRSHGRMRGLTPVFLHHAPDLLEPRLRVNNEDRDVNDILKSATRSLQNPIQIVERASYL